MSPWDDAADRRNGRRHDPETGCSLTLLLLLVVSVALFVLLAWLVDWRLPTLIWTVAAILVVGVLIVVDATQRSNDRRR